MRKNMIRRSADLGVEYSRRVNHKRSRRWLCEETILLNKYCLSSRYMDLYVL